MLEPNRKGECKGLRGVSAGTAIQQPCGQKAICCVSLCPVQTPVWVLLHGSSISLVPSEQGCVGDLVSSRAENLFSSSIYLFFGF